jgi:hypothetical protein
MDRRSTNVKGFVHYGGDVRSGAQDGIGFSIGSASTGSTAWIESVSDDTNAHLGIRAQGAGTITIGTSSNVVSISGTKMAAYSTTFAWTLAALTSGAQGEITLASTTCNVNPGDLVGLIELYPAAEDDFTVQYHRTSTVNTSRVTIVVGNIGSTATSTASGTGRISWVDLT